MTGWWHRLTGRSLEAQRPRAFASAACVLLLVAAGLALTAHGGAPAPTNDPSATTTVSYGARPAVIMPPLADDPHAASSTDSGRYAVIGQARRFLSGYLSYLYGQGPVRGIRGSTDALRRRLSRARLRVSPAARRRHPRIVRVTAEPLDSDRWHVVATVADGGVARYPIELLIATQAHGARVVEVSSE